MSTSKVALVVLALVLVAPATGHASGRGCTVEGYQVKHNGDRVPTLECQAALLGRVARDHGLKISSAAILRNPALKETVCDAVGSDHRIQIACVLP
jgi:hypothetical protein